MRNVESWRATKAEPRNGQWRGSRRISELNVESRLMADIQIGAYQSAIQSHAHGFLVDLGCGKMPYYGIYRDRVTNVIGIDWAESLHDSPHVDLLCNLNSTIPLADGCTDTVLCTDVLEHIYNPALFLKEIGRILRRNGIAIVGTPFLYPIHEAPNDYHRYTNFALERYANEAGLKVLSITPTGGLFEVLADMLCKATRKIPAASNGFRLLMQCISRLPAIRRSSERSAAQFPLSYISILIKADGDLR